MKPAHLLLGISLVFSAAASAAPADLTTCQGRQKDCSRKCGDGDAATCMLLGEYYELQRKRGVDYDKAAAAYETACDAGVGAGCVAWGRLRMSMRAHGNPTELFRKMKRQCKKGVADACSSLGLMYFQGHGVASNNDKALKSFEKACKGGVDSACTRAAGFYCEEDDEDPQCKNWILKSCTPQGGCADLMQSPWVAVPIWETQCKRGSAAACVTGAELASSKTKDVKKASRLGAKACKAGVARGCTIQARGLKRGKKHWKDEDLALELLRRACNAKDAEACRELGMATIDGTLGEEDAGKGRALVSTACDSEDGYACTLLGWMYWKGESVREDPKRADGYFQRGCKLGHQQGCGYLQTLRIEQAKAAEEEEEDEEEEEPRRKSKRRAEADLEEEEDEEEEEPRRKSKRKADPEDDL